MRCAIAIGLTLFGLTLAAMAMILIWAPTTIGKWRLILDILVSIIVLLGLLFMGAVIWDLLTSGY